MLATCNFTDPASLRFKRAQAVFVREWEEALELVAFVETVSENAARWIFGWGYAEILAYREIKRHVGAHAKRLTRDNVASLGVDDGVAVLRAMQRGGWKRGKLPDLVKKTLGQMHSDGMSYAKIGRLVGMKPDAVQWALRVKKSQQSAVSYGVLGIG